MSRYVTLKCMDCNYEKQYVQRTADGHRCPKCDSGLFIPKSTPQGVIVDFFKPSNTTCPYREIKYSHIKF